jgi:multidrug/hemolysin transport system permease protein
MTHAAAMYKQILSDGELAALFAEAPPETLQAFRQAYGVVLDFGGVQTNFIISAIVLAAATVIFYVISLIVMKTRKD